MTELNYEEDLRIDLNCLHVEFQRQPSLYMKYSELSAQANLECDQAKEKIDVVKAQLDGKIRVSPEAFGLSKVTEGAITSTIIVHKDYKDACESYNQAKLKASLLKSAVSAFDHRKKAMEVQAQLWLGGYWCTPAVSGAPVIGKNVVNQTAEKSSDKQSQTLRRKTQ